ncbi:TPA: SGNH/GDSL hydrolase family protein [Enterobacter cloacae]|nr:SGNH/GDSL hydrolase family protein [Enterobacter cloacae]
MATTPTQNSVPSESPIDLKFNAGKIDEFVTSFSQWYVDRFGVQHYTIEGLKQLVLQQIYNLGWNLKGTFQGGGTVSAAGDLLQDTTSLIWYRWDDLASLPKTVPAGSTPSSSGGTGPGKWQAVDVSATLTQKIISATGDLTIDAALDNISVSAYAIKNRRLLGYANEKLRKGETLSIVCVGDSVTAGYDTTSSDKVPADNGDWATHAPTTYPSRLASKLNYFTTATVNVVNRGYSGDTVVAGYNRWTTNPNCHVAHIMYGLNDSGNDLVEYGNYIEKQIRKYISWGCGVVIHTTTAVRFGNLNNAGARFAQHARSIAKAYDCPIFESEGVHQYCDYKSVYSDDIHFNKAGYAKYGDAVCSFILSGGWVREQIRNICTYTAQQPGRSTEGIGWFGKNVSLGNNDFAYVWNGQTGSMNANLNAIHSFSFFLDAEAANVFIVGNIPSGATVICSDPATTVDGYEASNKVQPKFLRKSIVETKPYTPSSRASQQGKKTWLGTLVGRGWKTVAIYNPTATQGFVNYFIVEPESPEDVSQSNSGIVPAKKEIYTYKNPVTGRANPDTALPATAVMPAKVYFPLPKSLYRSSQPWSSFFDSLTIEIVTKTVASAGGATYNGVHKMIAYQDAGATLAIGSIFKTAANCLTPSGAKLAWQDPNNAAGTINDGAIPPNANRDAIMFLLLEFPTAPAGYFSVEVTCNAQLDSYGAWLD